MGTMLTDGIDLLVQVWGLFTQIPILGIIAGVAVVGMGLAALLSAIRK